MLRKEEEIFLPCPAQMLGSASREAGASSYDSGGTGGIIFSYYMEELW